MTDILLGIIGAAVAIAAFISGVLFRVISDKRDRCNAEQSPAATEDEETEAQKAHRLKLIAEQKAFQHLQNYNVTQAYGMNDIDGINNEGADEL